MSRSLWIVIGTLVGGAVGFAIGWVLAADDLGQLGDWTHGSERFIGFTSAFGLIGGHLLARRLTLGVHKTRDGFTLSYRRIEPTAKGYREIETLTVADVLGGLRAVGYEPAAAACDATGTVRGTLDPTTPLAGANMMITDPKVRGEVRILLAPPPEGNKRAMGLVEIWSIRGDSAEELALFALNVLGELVGDLQVSRESSSTSADPVAIVTAGLGDRPVHR